MIAIRDEYNSSQPLTLVMDNVWLMSAKFAAWKPNVLLENGIGAILCVAPGSEANNRGRGKIASLEGFDANDMMEGVLDVEILFEALVALHKHARRHGVGIYCRNGANRPPFVMIAFLVSMTGEKPETIEDHIRRLRLRLDEDDHIT